jgi:hypothetical protein
MSGNKACCMVVIVVPLRLDLLFQAGLLLDSTTLASRNHMNQYDETQCDRCCRQNGDHILAMREFEGVRRRDVEHPQEEW